MHAHTRRGAGRKKARSRHEICHSGFPTPHPHPTPQIPTEESYEGAGVRESAVGREGTLTGICHAGTASILNFSMMISSHVSDATEG